MLNYIDVTKVTDFEKVDLLYNPKANVLISISSVDRLFAIITL